MGEFDFRTQEFDYRTNRANRISRAKPIIKMSVCTAVLQGSSYKLRDLLQRSNQSWTRLLPTQRFRLKRFSGISIEFDCTFCLDWREVWVSALMTDCPTPIQIKCNLITQRRCKATYRMCASLLNKNKIKNHAVDKVKKLGYYRR